MPLPELDPVATASSVKLLVVVHVAATLLMTGVIWMVQVVHYPLFAKVGASTFALYQADHMRLITYVVFPLMMLELVTALLLVWVQPFGIPVWQWYTGLALLAIIWLSTAFLQVPLHNILTLGFEAEAHRRLVTTNWVRTVAWSTRSLLMLDIVLVLLPR